jgi:hypothetical protein
VQPLAVVHEMVEERFDVVVAAVVERARLATIKARNHELAKLAHARISSLGSQP